MENVCFAIEGKHLEKLLNLEGFDRQVFEYFFNNCVVFARMKPEQKAQIIQVI
jgi:magnesium-transporting ATPase (P-type)